MNDPTPWAEEDPPFAEEFNESTQENVERAEDEAAEEERQQFQDRYLWNKYAGRLKKDGGLTR